MSSAWQTLRMKDVMAEFYDGPHATPAPAEEGPVFLGIKNLTEDGHLDLADIRHIAEADFPKWTKRVEPRPGDLVFTYEASLHRYAIIPSGFRGVLGRRVALIRPNSSVVDTRFLLYLFLSPQWRSAVTQRINIGSTVDRIPLVEFPHFPVTVPSLRSQRKVAAILSVYDDLIETNMRRIKILEEMAQRIYREWFVEFRYPGHEGVPLVDSEAGPRPRDWGIRVCTDAVDILSGGTPKTTEPEYWDGDIPFFTPRDAPSALLALRTEKAITQQGLERCNSQLFEAGTVFITARGTVGKVVMAAVPMAMNQSCYAVRGRPGVSQEFVLLALSNQVSYLKANTGGATFDTIVVDTFRRMKMAIPPSRLIEEFSRIARPMLALEHRLLAATDTLRSSRDLLLPRLISGEIDVEDLDIDTSGLAA